MEGDTVGDGGATGPSLVDYETERARALAANATGDWAAAVTLWDACVAVDPRPPGALIEKVAALLKLRRHDVAQPLLVEAITRYGDLIPLRLLFARCAHMRRDWAAAEDRWTRLLALNPDHFEGRMKRAEALSGLGRADEALEIVDDLLTSGRHAGDAALLELSARVREARGEWGAAAEAWDAYAASPSGAGRRQVERVQALARAGRVGDATDLLAATDMKPADRIPLLTLVAETAEGKGDDDAAAQLWRTVLAVRPGAAGVVQRLRLVSARIAERDGPSRAEVDAWRDRFDQLTAEGDVEGARAWLEQSRGACTPLELVGRRIGLELSAEAGDAAAALVAALPTLASARSKVSTHLRALLRSISDEEVPRVIETVSAPGVDWLTLELAKALADTPFHAHCDRLFRAALGEAPQDAGQLNGWLAYARHSLKLGGLEAAERALRAVLDFSPGDIQAQILQLRLHRDTGDWAAGDRLAERLKSIDAPSVFLALANYAYGARRYAQVEAMAAGLDERTLDVALLTLLADNARASMHFGVEVRRRLRLAAMRPGADALTGLAQAQAAEGDAEAAMVSLTRALALEPLNYGAYDRLKQLDPERAAAYAEPADDPLDTLSVLSFRAHRLIDENDVEGALALLERSVEDTREHAPMVLLLASTLRYAGRLDDAARAYARYLRLDPVSARASRATGDLALVLCDQGRHEEAAEVLDREARLFRLGTWRALEAAVRREISLGRCDLATLWPTYRAAAVVQAMASVPDKLRLNHDLFAVAPGADLLLVASYGVGDEIRWSSVYPDLLERFGRVAATCDPRLEALFRRSFPTLEVVPTRRRMREVLAGEAYRNYDQLPDQELARVFDNAAWARASRADAVSLVSDALAAHRASVEAFPAQARLLIADPRARSAWRARLESLPPGLNVGISWRSLVMNAVRGVHYTDLNDWGPILSIPGVNFVNLQYGEPETELAEARRRFDASIHAFPELDLKDDLDGLAALLSELDLVLAPCTTLAELAGAVGARTLMMGNAPSLKWRDRDAIGDLWFPSLRLVHGDRWFDKPSLIANTASAVRRIAGERAPERVAVSASAERRPGLLGRLWRRAGG